MKSVVHALAIALASTACNANFTLDTARLRSPLAESRAAPAPFFTARWGSGMADLGHALREEAVSDGPQSLTTDLSGNLWILDQVNARIQVVASTGEVIDSIAIDTTTAEDLAVAPDGRFVLLDRTREASLLFFDADGRRRGAVPYVGNGVAEPAMPQALFFFDGWYGVEVDGGTVIRIADLQGRHDDDRTPFEGHPARSGGRWIKADLVDAERGLVAVWDAAQSGALTNRREVKFDLPIRTLRYHGTDAAGRIYVGVHLVLQRDQEPFDAIADREELVVLDNEGVVLNRATFASTQTGEEQFQTFTVAADGTVYHLRCTDDAAIVTRWR